LEKLLRWYNFLQSNDERGCGEFFQQLRTALAELELIPLGDFILRTTAAAMHIKSGATTSTVESVLGMETDAEIPLNADALFHATAQLVVSALFQPPASHLHSKNTNKPYLITLTPLVSSYGQHADWIQFGDNYFKDAMFILQITKDHQLEQSQMNSALLFSLYF
jgi:hypothetical protein